MQQQQIDAKIARSQNHQHDDQISAEQRIPEGTERMPPSDR